MTHCDAIEALVNSIDTTVTADHLAATRTAVSSAQALAKTTRTASPAERTAAYTELRETEKAYGLAMAGYYLAPAGADRLAAELAAARTTAAAALTDLGVPHLSLDHPAKAAIRNLEGTERTLRDLAAARDRVTAAVGPSTSENIAAAFTAADELPIERSIQYQTTWNTHVVIGSLAIDEAYEVTDRSFATASWYRTHRVLPGVYEVRATIRDRIGERYNFDRITIDFDTEIVAENFPSTLMGRTYANPRDKDNIGKPSRYQTSMYAYQYPLVTAPGMPWLQGHLVPRKGVQPLASVFARSGGNGLGFLSGIALGQAPEIRERIPHRTAAAV